MVCKKIAIGTAAAITLVVGSAVSYKVVTGECPMKALCTYVHGNKAEEAKQAPTPAN